MGVLLLVRRREEPSRLKFENLGPLPVRLVLGSFNDQHNRFRIMLSMQMEILQDIAEGR